MSANLSAWVVIVLLGAALAASVVIARVRRRRNLDRWWRQSRARNDLSPDRRRPR